MDKTAILPKTAPSKMTLVKMVRWFVSVIIAVNRDTSPVTAPNPQVVILSATDITHTVTIVVILETQEDATLQTILPVTDVASRGTLHETAPLEKTMPSSVSVTDVESQAISHETVQMRVSREVATDMRLTGKEGTSSSLDSEIKEITDKRATFLKHSTVIVRMMKDSMMRQ